MRSVVESVELLKPRITGILRRNLYIYILIAGTGLQAFTGGSKGEEREGGENYE